MTSQSMHQQRLSGIMARIARDTHWLPCTAAQPVFPFSLQELRHVSLVISDREMLKVDCLIMVGGIANEA
jgi:hypothetical protein